MLHGYCLRFASDPGPEEDLTGIDGAPVFRADVGKLQLWASEHAGGPATVDRLRQHETVVRRALRTATPLPLRYGTRFASVAAAESALSDRAEEFADALHRLRDQVEMSVRVESSAADAETPPERVDEEAPQPASGRRYLERRRAELHAREQGRARAEEVLSELASELAELGLATVVTPLPQGTTLGTVAHLVHRGALRPYRQRVEELRRAHPELRITLSGPWAPYSFV